MQQLDIFSLFGENRKSPKFQDQKFTLYLNKLEDLEIKTMNLLNDFDFIEIDTSNVNKEENKYSYQNIFKKDKEFYKKYLLSINTFDKSHAVLMFKKSDIDYAKKVKENSEYAEKITFKTIDRINTNMRCSILNLLLKASLKYKYKNMNFMNSSSEYIKFIEYVEIKNEKEDPTENFKGFIPCFKTNINHLGELEYFLTYSVRNFKKYNSLNEKLKKKRSEYQKFGIVGKDLIAVFDDDLSNTKYIETAKTPNTKTTHEEISFYENKYKLLENNLKELKKAKAFMFYDVVNDLKTYFGKYVSFKFTKISKNDYIDLPYKGNGSKCGKEKSDKYKKILEKQYENKKILIINNTNAKEDYPNLIKKGIEKLNIKAKIDIENEFKKDYDYIINLTYEPSLYEKYEFLGKDPYREHDFIIPTKNFIVENKKIKEKKKQKIQDVEESKEKVTKGLEPLLKGMLLSLLVEEDLINSKSNLLSLSGYKDNISFIKYKYGEYLYQIKLFNDGKIKINAINDKYSDRIKKLGINQDEESKNIKLYFDYVYKKELDQGRYIYKNKIKNNNNEMYIINGDFSYDIAEDNILILKKTFYKPILSPQVYKDIFIDKNIVDDDADNRNDKKMYPLTWVSGGKSNAGNEAIGFKKKEYRELFAHSYSDIKIFKNKYLSGYKNENFRSSYESSSIAREIIGANSKDLLKNFADEQFFEYKSVNNRFAVRPLTYKYLTVLENIVENKRINKE